MRISASGYQEVCSDCEAYGSKKHGLTRSDCIGGCITLYYHLVPSVVLYSSWVLVLIIIKLYKLQWIEKYNTWKFSCTSFLN